MDKIITVFDIDDVFWPLNEHVAVIAGIDYKKIVTFRAKDNPLLDAAARQRLHDAYQTPRLHADMDFYPGAELFGVLAKDPRIDPWLCSNSIDTDVISDKKRNMHLFLGTDYDRFRTMYNIISMEKSGEKKFPDGVRILIDDSPLNAVASGAAHVIMRRHPWNQSDWGRNILAPIMDRVRYYSHPQTACRIIRGILDTEAGPLPG